MSELTADDLSESTGSFYTALADVLGGDATSMLELWSHEPDITYIGPMGALLVGWEEIRVSWLKQAEARLGGRVTPSELHFVPGGRIGVVTGWELGELHNGLPGAVHLRATSTYRLEDGEVRMIGHHTDLIKT